MLSIKECKEILGNEAKELTDQEILEMRDFISILAEILIESTLEKDFK
jgi:hypothetical protein